MQRVEAGNKPAWATPINARLMNKRTNAAVAPTSSFPAPNATVIAPNMPNTKSERLAPQRSTRSPVGIWKQA
jgi:hypothetical protein